MCLICGKDKETRYIDLCVIGSEGLNICHSCEMKLVEHVHVVIREQMEIRKNNFKLGKPIYSLGEIEQIIKKDK